MTYAATADLATLLGRTLTPAEEGKAGTILELVDLAIDDHLDGRTADAGLLNKVATFAARRLFLIPDGIRQEVLGDWQASYAPAEVLSADERRLLDSGVGTGGVRRRRHGSPLLSADIWHDPSPPSWPSHPRPTP